MVITQRESSVCVEERRLTQSREGRNGGWTASSLNELRSCRVGWDLQGSPNGFIYTSFSPTFLFMWSLTPTRWEAGSMWRAPTRKVGLLRSAYSVKFSLSLKWSAFLVAQGKKRKPIHPFQVESHLILASRPLARVCREIRVENWYFCLFSLTMLLFRRVREMFELFG